MNRLSWVDRQRLRLHAWLALEVPLDILGSRIAFRCTTAMEAWRALTAKTKEAGTVAWIEDHVQPGEVFCDVGANIGLYSLMAALRVGKSGAVYAFEPHAANFLSLVSNIALNGQQGVIQPFSCALHDREGLFPFHYENLGAGRSMSQLDAMRDGEEREFRPVISEGKLAITLDQLIERGLRAPHHVKLDVDGNELPILRGMQRLLSGGGRPRSVQVEINERYREALMTFMQNCGYALHHRHHTSAGLARIAQGADPATIPHNAVFVPG